MGEGEGGWKISSVAVCSGSNSFYLELNAYSLYNVYACAIAKP